MRASWRQVARAVEPWGVAAVALHSAAVGVALMLAPSWAASFGGFGELDSPFFARQAGAFHLVVVVAYLGEYRLYRSVRMLVATKAIAVVFLATAWLGGETAWSVPLSALADGLMALVAACVHGAAASPEPNSS